MLNMSTHIYLVIYYLYQVSYVFSRWWIVDGRNPVILVMLIMVYQYTHYSMYKYNDDTVWYILYYLVVIVLLLLFGNVVIRKLAS